MKSRNDIIPSLMIDYAFISIYLVLSWYTYTIPQII